jgi:hypothetical protein
LYAQLVRFVDVDERTSHFAPEEFDPSWFADVISASCGCRETDPNSPFHTSLASKQKAQAEQQQAQQHSSKRARIDFASSSSSGRMKNREQDSDMRSKRRR